MPRRHEISSAPENMVWGYLDRDTPPVLEVSSGDTVTLHSFPSGGKETLPDDLSLVAPDYLAALEALPPGPGSHFSWSIPPTPARPVRNAGASAGRTGQHEAASPAPGAASLGTPTTSRPATSTNAAKRAGLLSTSHTLPASPQPDGTVRASHRITPVVVDQRRLHADARPAAGGRAHRRRGHGTPERARRRHRPGHLPRHERADRLLRGDGGGQPGRHRGPLTPVSPGLRPPPYAVRHEVVRIGEPPPPSVRSV